MKGELYIWAPVIMGKLYEPRVINLDKSYPLGEGLNRIEDLKIKLREYEAGVYGTSIAVKMKADILCLVERGNGIQLKTWQEVINDNIALGAFAYEGKKEEEIQAHIKILDFSVRGEEISGEIHVGIHIIYTVFITSYREVRIAEAGEENGDDWQEECFYPDMAGKIERLSAENYHLKQRLFMYEQDIKSLKQGIKKAERRNIELKEQLNNYKKMTEKQDNGRMENRDIFWPAKKASMMPGEIALGRRIKKMFRGE